MTTTVTTITQVTQVEDVTELDPWIEALIVELNNAKAGIKALEIKKAAADAAIREALNGNSVGRINGVERIRVQQRNLTKIDRDLLKTAFPEAYEAAMVETTYTVLQAK